MQIESRIIVWSIVISPLTVLNLLAEEADNASGQATLEFARDVLPILSDHCFSCHGADEGSREAELRLDIREHALAVKDGVVAIVPGQPKSSDVIRRIRATDDDIVMPPPDALKPLSAAQKDILQRWIGGGAQYAGHWAFRPPKRVDPPAIRQIAWLRNAIDRFVLKRLEFAGLAPRAEAKRHTWLRRVTLDLTGLPPTIGELDAFLTDDSPNAESEVVDRLLKSEAYAERMAMHWLDAARYADTNGYNNDETRTMWPWRDWVINAIHSGMTYDRFLTEQLAGDLLPSPTISQRVATGFNRNHVLTTEGGIIPEEYQAEYVADRVHTTATVFMGISLRCARCHEHKFDPFTQRDYYRFAAYFNNIPDRIVSYNSARMADPVLKVPSPTQQRELDQLNAQQKKLTAELKTRAAGRTDKQAEAIRNDLKAFTDRIAAIEKAIPVTMVMEEMKDRRPTHILIRGQYDKLGDEVSPGLPVSLVGKTSTHETTRLDLARWLTDPAHPLTARVAVNRWWEMLFGTGLVETAEDFGVQGARPSHPELLDWLATELIRQKWDQRAILKLIVLSATYRQSSDVTPQLLDADPRNRLLSRGSRWRLPAEMVRDNALAVCGLLHRQIGGPSVRPYQPAGLWEDVSVERRDKYVTDTGPGLYRRSMYTFWKRTCPPPSMSAFDAPDREFCVIRRARTNTPLQALVLLNDPTYVEAARAFADRIIHHNANDTDRLNFAFRRAVARLPGDAEQAVVNDLLAAARKRFTAQPVAAKELLSVGSSKVDTTIEPAELAAWTSVASILLNLDETISKP
ncbi:MAG: hypothetical protein CMJ64_22340 [Planctomycetaceae bacterium]|nr:hypothetical protein [Planctomycetaceae bacterium]